MNQFWTSKKKKNKKTHHNKEDQKKKSRKPHFKPPKTVLYAKPTNNELRGKYYAFLLQYCDIWLIFQDKVILPPVQLTYIGQPG